MGEMRRETDLCIVQLTVRITVVVHCRIIELWTRSTRNMYTSISCSFNVQPVHTLRLCSR